MLRPARRRLSQGKASEAVSDLVSALRLLSPDGGNAATTNGDEPTPPEQRPAKTAKLVHATAYTVHAGQQEYAVTSWNLNEFAYNRHPCPFPTRARGLFTAHDGGDVIVARGYDKFFNVGEVAWTHWEALERDTRPPYYLTLKSNGCIIFVAALSPTSLLVTSKHAVGATRTSTQEGLKQGDLTHAGVGEKWLELHLASVSKTRADLAAELWEANVTAVAELTDDSFEEHVLPTPKSATGLNLHGLNLNLPGPLQTYPPDIVNQFAKRWGMHGTDYKTVTSIAEVRRECEVVEKSGWGIDGSMVEGIVVRGQPIGVVADNAPSSSTSRDEDGPCPMSFWKVKFEEPYLQYRNWREITRRMLTSRKRAMAAFSSQRYVAREQPSAKKARRSAFMQQEMRKSVDVSRMKDPVTRLYADYVLTRMLSDTEEDEKLWEEWSQGRGIVKTRDDFFAWRNTGDGLAADLVTLSTTGPKKTKRETFDKTLLVPIGVPGCGKTTLAVALKAYLGLLHTQSDDVTTRKTAAGFVKNVKDLLLSDGPTSSVPPGAGQCIVFADKNNHLKTHRKAMADLVASLEEGIPQGTVGKSRRSDQWSKNEVTYKQIHVRLVALVWNIQHLSQDVMHSLVSKRIIQRGDNHQSLRPEKTPDGVDAHKEILWRFLKDMEPFDPSLNALEDGSFDEVIELNVEAPMVQSLQVVVDKLRTWYPDIAEPTLENLDGALKASQEYKAELKKDMQLDSGFHKRTTLPTQPRYFAISLPNFNLVTYIHTFLDTLTDPILKHQGYNMLDRLIKAKRVTTQPHVTLLHAIEALKHKPGPVDGQERGLDTLWHHYQSLPPHTKATVDVGPRIMWTEDVMVIEVSHLEPVDVIKWGNRPALTHITVGTVRSEVKAVEGKHLNQRVLKGQLDGVAVASGSIQTIHGVIKGM